MVGEGPQEMREGVKEMLVGIATRTESKGGRYLANYRRALDRSLEGNRDTRDGTSLSIGLVKGEDSSLRYAQKSY